MIMLNQANTAGRNDEIERRPLGESLKEKARLALQTIINSDKSKSQQDFAKFINMSPGAVSKILINENSHPMTIIFARGLSEYVGLSLDEIFGKNSIFSHLSNRTPEEFKEAPKEIFDESLQRLSDFVAPRYPKIMSRRKLNELAEMVATQVEKTDRSPEEYQEAIFTVLIREVMNA